MATNMPLLVQLTIIYTQNISQLLTFTKIKKKKTLKSKQYFHQDDSTENA